MLTSSELRNLLFYNPETGQFIWCSSPTNSIAAGRVAGTGTLNGYVSVSIDKKMYLAHRLAWLYVYGDWPPGNLDHRDRNKKNNRIDNLRVATRSQNSANVVKRVSKSGFKGVSYIKGSRKWMARARQNYKHIYLGLFETPEAAHQAYLQKSKELHGEFQP